MTTAIAKDLKSRTADVFSRVQYGSERVAVTRYGKDAAEREGTVSLRRRPGRSRN